MEKPIKNQYETPKLKEHGVVRELTQSGSGGKKKDKKPKKPKKIK